jgi:hypothetical protein
MSQTERILVTADSTAIGLKQARGTGTVGLQVINSTPEDHTRDMFEISIGRGSSWKNQVTATAKLTPAKAHELACVLMHLTKNQFPCDGGKVAHNSTRSYNYSHNASVEVSIKFNIDLCRVLNDPEGLKEELLEKTKEALKLVPKGEIVKNE